MKTAIKGTDTLFLPTTEKRFDWVIKNLVKMYKLPSPEHATAIVAQRIQHLPPDQATTTWDYLGHSVLKNVAFQVAKAKSDRMMHNMQVDGLVAELTANPTNQQARDALDQAITEGSDYAKAATAKLPHIYDSQSATPLFKRTSTPEETGNTAQVTPEPA